MISLDTNVVIGAMSGRDPRIMAKLADAFRAGTNIRMSSVVLFELRYGIAKSQRPERNGAVLRRFLEAPIDIDPFDLEDAAEAGFIRAELERQAQPIGHYDILIAAQARRRNATLITANQREFLRVPDLLVEDWTR